MNRFPRGPLAVVCMGVGAIGALVAQDQLRGQPPTVTPPPAAQQLPAPQPVAAAPAAVVRDPHSLRDVVKKVTPAVVNLVAKRLDPKPARKTSQLPPGVPEEFRRFFELPDDDVKPDPNLGFGSGVLIDPAGIVLTNYHVVEGADTVEVSLPDGRTFTSKDIRRDAKSDLAIVKLPADRPLPFLELGDSDAMAVGDRVVAVGAPFGLTGSVTSGIVSAKSRHNLRLNQYEDFIQTDAAINPGNSGGPLVNMAGQVIGINSAIKTRSGGFQGVGLAVSSNLAREVASQLIRHGVVRRGYLGVGVRELDDELADRFGVPKGTGVVVSKVYDDSPAAAAGLQVGDVITAVAGTPVKELDTLPKVIAKLQPKQPTELAVVRDGKPVTLTAVIAEQPEEYGLKTAVPARPAPGAARVTPVPVPAAGLTVADLTEEVAGALRYPNGTRGAVVVAVDRTGPAADTGLVRGQVVVKVDRTPVASAKEFADAIAAADPERGALLHVMRPTGEVDFVVLKVR